MGCHRCSAEVHLTIASDVSNPLLGESGAAAIYGPQKGLRPDDVTRLDGYLSRYADLLQAATGLDVRDVPGAGAAGGTTASLFAIANRFASFEIRPGIDVVMELTDFDARLAESDLAISGEGRIDAQTAFGKTCLGVARKAAAAGVGCVCFGGSVTPEGEAALRDRGCGLVPRDRVTDDCGGRDGSRFGATGTRRGARGSPMVPGGRLSGRAGRSGQGARRCQSGLASERQGMSTDVPVAVSTAEMTPSADLQVRTWVPSGDHT